MNNRAFTLLELLVVITIIGILSSIVIVSMSGSTDSATIAKGKAYAQQVHALLGVNAVGVWNFDERTGTTLADISGYGNNGTLNKGANGTGLDWVTSDINGYALSFDGIDDYIDCGNDESLQTNDGTATIWVKMNSIADGKYVLAKAGNNGWTQLNWHIKLRTYLTTTGWSVAIADETGDWKQTGPSGSAIAGRYYFLAMEWEWNQLEGRTYMKLYIDGIYNTGSSDTVQIGKNRSIKIGGVTASGTYIDGLIDEVRIYSEALPSTEIQKHYVQGLNKLLVNQAITQVEYDQRMEEFNQYLASNKF